VYNKDDELIDHDWLVSQYRELYDTEASFNMEDIDIAHAVRAKMFEKEIQNQIDQNSHLIS